MAGVNTEKENCDRKLRLLGKLRIIKGPTGSDFRNHGLAAEQINKAVCDWSHQTRGYFSKIIKLDSPNGASLPNHCILSLLAHEIQPAWPSCRAESWRGNYPDVLRFWDWIEVLTQNLSVWQHLTVWTVKCYWFYLLVYLFMSLSPTWGCSGWHGNVSQTLHFSLLNSRAAMPVCRAGKQRPLPSPSSLSDTGRKQRHKDCSSHCPAAEQCRNTGIGQGHWDRAGTLSGQTTQLLRTKGLLREWGTCPIDMKCKDPCHRCSLPSQIFKTRLK